MTSLVWLLPRMTSLICLLPMLVTMCHADLASERTANTVEVKLYPLSKSEWSGSKVSEFRSAIATYAIQYCSQNQVLCGISNTNPSFVSSDVGIVSTEDNSKSMFAEFYIDIPTIDRTTDGPLVLTQDTIELISKQARDEIHSQTGTWITYIEETYLGVPVQTTANAVIIPVACLVVVAIALATILLVMWSEKNEKQNRKLRREARRQEISVGSINQTTQNSVVVRKDKVGFHGNGNKVVPNGQPRHDDLDIVVTTRPRSKFTEKVEMAPISRNHFQEEADTEREVTHRYTGQQTKTEEIPQASQYVSGSELDNTRVLSHTSVINGQLVDTVSPPSYSATVSQDRQISQEEEERKRRKREKRERRAERERRRAEKEGYGRFEQNM